LVAKVQIYYDIPPLFYVIFRKKNPESFFFIFTFLWRYRLCRLQHPDWAFDSAGTAFCSKRGYFLKKRRYFLKKTTLLFKKTTRFFSDD